MLIAQQNHHRSLAALFAEALETSEERVIVLREHAFPIPPTWKQVHEQLAMLQARKNIRYVTVPREELVEWLAAESMLSAARSKDLSDDQGRSIEHERVVEWLRRRWEKRRSSFLDTLMVSAGEAPAGEAPVPDKPAASEKQRRPPARPAAPPKVSSPEPDPTGDPEDIALEKLVVSQLLKLGVSASVARRHVGARLIRLEVTAPRQRVADLDRAAADVEHKLSEREVSFEREGPRRFFTAPRREPRPVLLSDLLRKEDAWLRERPGRFVLGERVDGETVKGDLADGGSCHLLVAGQTGSGKSVLLRALLLGLAKWHSPERIRFTLGDPKRVTFGALADTLAAHLRRPVCYNAEAIVLGLEKLAEEMDARYSIFQKGHFQDVLEHNASRSQKLPLEVVILDEFADLVLDKAYKQAFLDSVKRIGNMGRAAGIHMILATQRPDRSSIPGEIKANLVGKVALKVQSSLNSRIILGEGGAEKLLGKGDFLADLGHGILRAQAPVVETPS